MSHPLKASAWAVAIVLSQLPMAVAAQAQGPASKDSPAHAATHPETSGTQAAEAASAPGESGGPASHRQAAHEKLERVVVSGNPQASAAIAKANKVLDGDALTLSRGSNLGDTLEAVPGVAGSFFGPNSNRPSLRGLDGDRVRILSNASASLDASSLSYDHAVPIDPLVVERIEVLHGAAALLYGGSAVGGAVNTLDNRIPRARQSGLSGAAELRLGGASSERGGAVVLDGGQGDWAWHLDGSQRRTDDQRTPAYLLDDGSVMRHVRNSDARSHSLAAGSSWHFSHGYAGLSLDDYRNDYGITVEPDIRIRMQRQRLAMAGELRWADSPIQRLQWQGASSRYAHQEIEGSGDVGTRFANRGQDMRVELEHAPVGPFRGVLGLQWESSRFEVSGEEAMVPTTRTRSAAAFMLERWQSGPLTLSAGLRAERVDVRSDGDGPLVSEPLFGPATEKRFKPWSTALSAEWALSPSFSLKADLSRSQRAPSFFELFANGLHVASGAYERGDAQLGLETARAAELGLSWSPKADTQIKFSIHETRFKHFIALNATGAQIEIEPHGEHDHGGAHEEVPEYRFEAVPARLYGWELEAKTALPWTGWSLAGQIDAVRGRNQNNGEALARLSPLKARLQLEGQWGAWAGQLTYTRHASQTRVPSVDAPTSGFGLWRFSLNRHLDWPGLHALWYLKLDNLGNTLAYNATAMATIRGLSPLPGRSVHTGLQIQF